MINQTEQTLYRLANLNAEQTRVTYQTSTGKILDKGSDDSTLYSREILIDDKIRTYEGIKYQIERTTVQNDASDSAISEIKKLYEVIKTELIKANTDTTSDEGKKAIALNIEGMKDNILTLANTQIEDEYLFAGSDSSVKPFSEDTNGDISYNGDNSARKIAVDDGTYRDRGVNGYEIMTYPASTATMGEALNFKASDIIIDEDGSLWKLNATNTAIEKYDKEDNLITPLETKSIDSNDGLTPATYQIDNISSDSGTKFEARTSIFDLIDDMVNTLNKVDSDGSAITDEQRDALLGEQQSSFSDAYDSLNVAHTNLGSINAMFESSLESVSSKLTQYNILSQEVGAADLTKLALESKSLELTYTALYSTIQKTNELSLANFLS
ncbi:flagellin N-terminal helical domain-containing protein [Poseidonibacter antarcticus]|uniref:flagellin N-terminal helical domain-containing protein n=1 Tax=Poseidonibacter antarcticus TaxID=2478538 RepID=UPI000EF4AAF0|nr:flagellar hook-associated protein 3 [Poseidonibacter antarcticus]